MSSQYGWGTVQMTVSYFTCSFNSRCAEFSAVPKLSEWKIQAGPGASHSQMPAGTFTTQHAYQRRERSTPARPRRPPRRASMAACVIDTVDTVDRLLTAGDRTRGKFFERRSNADPSPAQAASWLLVSLNLSGLSWRLYLKQRRHHPGSPQPPPHTPLRR